VSEIVTRFDTVRRSAPGRTLIQLPATGSEWSADDLWQAHQRYAARLTQMGVGSGDLVVSAAGNSAASVAFLLACRAVDAAVLPADSGTKSHELQALAQRFGARGLFLPTAAAPDPRFEAAHTLLLDEPMFLCPTRDVQQRRYAGSAVLKLTSGSTNIPRAAVTTDGQLIADSTRLAAAMNIMPSDVQMATIPVSHAYGLGNLVMPLLLQGTQVVMRDSFIPLQLMADARRSRARLFPGVPFMFEFFLSLPPTVEWPPSLTSLISAGAPLKQGTVRAFHARFGLKIHSFYGTSESGGITFDGGDEIDDSGTVGFPIPGVTVTLRDQEDVKGRVHVASSGVATGYTDGPDDVFTDGGFLTGDYGTWDERGRLALGGRVSSFVNVAGHKVRPDEVEDVLRAMPGVADVRVIGADDSRRGEQIVACVVAERAGTIQELAVRRFCAARLAPHKIPRAIVFVDAIPTTARGKVDRTALAHIIKARLSV
jgi:acyl-CoA synthetase (AMP-forming)/AMP-acid ligase II